MTLGDLFLNVFYRRVDGSVPIVFLHGWGGSIESFLKIASSFDRTILLLDFWGHGKSCEPIFPKTVENFADDLIEIFDSLNIEKFDIVAHSFGGRVAIVLASKYGNRVQKMLLTGCAGFVKKRKFVTKMRIFAFKICKLMVRLCILHKKMLDRFGSSDWKDLSPNMRQTFSKVVCDDLTRFVSDIECEVLFVWGEEDKETPIEFAYKFLNLIAKSELIIFEGCGHFAYLEDYFRFVLIAHDFLNRRELCLI